MLPSNGWIPANLNINSTGGYEPVAGTPYFKLTGTTSVDFDDVPGATHYVLWLCPKRLTKDATVEGLLNHYPSCGTKQTWATPNSYFEILNAISLMPGDKYLAFIAAYDATGFSYSSVFEIQAVGVSAYSQELGNMEYCTTQGAATTVPVVGAVNPAPKPKGRK